MYATIYVTMKITTTCSKNSHSDKNFIVSKYMNPQWRDRKKNNIQGDIRTLLGKSCEVEKMMWFLKETEMFEEYPTRSACRKQCLIVIDDFDSG